MFFTGISDEAGKAIETQIKAHQQLGWNHLELRAIGDGNLASLSEAEYRNVYEQLQQAKMTVSCFSSGIANWAKKITTDFQLDVTELTNSIPRMHELNTKFIRIMSYPNDGWAEKKWFDEVIRRLKELSKIAADNGLILVHENCSGYGGISADHTLRMLEAVNSPALKLVFDTGNTPAEGQNSWDYYQKVKEHIVYIHIKDAKMHTGKGETEFTFPGEGDGDVRRIVADALANGYDNGFSIEPHLAAIVHLAQESENAEAQYNTYVEYGERFKKLMAEIQK